MDGASRSLALEMKAIDCMPELADARSESASPYPPAMSWLTSSIGGFTIAADAAPAPPTPAAITTHATHPRQ